MHQQAILVAGNANLGIAGTLVSIDDIERHYSTTTTANAGASYKCADPMCGVPVIAVITKIKKATRKNSPSSYFRANKSRPHVRGCTRAPSPSLPIAPSHGGQVNPANPNRTNAPVVWVDPLTKAGTTTIGGNIGSPTGVPSNLVGGKRRSSGSGTSQGRSQMVESFAKKWLSMNTQTQRSTPLAAPWNLDGSYYTAFHAFAYRQTTNISSASQKIYVGMLKQVVQTQSGYVVSIKEVNVGGEALEVFIPLSAFQFGAPSAALQSILSGLIATTKTTKVFVLGKFSPINSSTLSLSVAHPYYVYIS